MVRVTCCNATVHGYMSGRITRVQQKRTLRMNVLLPPGRPSQNADAPPKLRRARPCQGRRRDDECGGSSRCAQFQPPVTWLVSNASSCRSRIILTAELVCIIAGLCTRPKYLQNTEMLQSQMQVAKQRRANKRLTLMHD